MTKNSSCQNFGKEQWESVAFLLKTALTTLTPKLLARIDPGLTGKIIHFSAIRDRLGLQKRKKDH